jgi:predicted alpha/beta-fold hydrolase
MPEATRTAGSPTVVLVHGAFGHSHRTIQGGVGRNLPQEGPQAFTEAVLEVGGRGR